MDTGGKKKGRPKETWRRTVERKRKHLGFRSWNDVGMRAKDRTVERTYPWSDSPHGETELSQSKSSQSLSKNSSPWSLL
jgi:hypothetical protein